jgi:hypothetical protein
MDNERQITLTFDDKTFKALRRAIQARAIASASSGLPDIFVAKLIEKIEDEVKSWHVIQKKEID